MTCPNCLSTQIIEYPKADSPKGATFAAQSYYDDEKVTTLGPAKRCTRCGNQDFRPRR